MCDQLVDLDLRYSRRACSLGVQDAQGLTGEGAMAVLRELGRLAGSADSAPATEQLGAALAHAREAGSREQVGPSYCRLRMDSVRALRHLIIATVENRIGNRPVLGA